MTIREGKWKCPGCREVNRGSVVQCAGCGATRDAHTQFFFDENDAPVVTDAEELKKAKAGPDWVCTFCDNSNPSASTTCSGCNAPKSAKAHAHGDVTPVGASGTGASGTGAHGTGAHGTGAPGTGAPLAKGLVAPAAIPPGGAKPSATPVKLGLFGSIVVFFLLACCCFAVLMGGAHEDVARVAQVEWTRSIEVEAVRPVPESQWDSSPAGAANVTHKREVRAHKDVQHGTKTVTRQERVQVGSHKEVTGHKDLGNGRFEDVEKDVPDYAMKDVTSEEPVYVSEPVYGEKYYFTMDRWTTIRTPDAHGTTEPPRWPDAGLSGKEREGAHHEKYGVAFEVKDQKDLKTFEPKDEADFLRFKPGSTWKVKWSGTEIKEVLKPADAAAGTGTGG